MPEQKPVRVKMKDGSITEFPPGTTPERISELLGAKVGPPEQKKPVAKSGIGDWWSKNEPMLPAEDIYRKYFEPKKPTPYGWSEADIGAKRGVSHVTQELSRPKSLALMGGMAAATMAQPHAMAPFILNALFSAGMLGDAYSQATAPAPPQETTRDKWTRGSSIGIDALLAAAPWALEAVRGAKTPKVEGEERFGKGLIPESWTSWMRSTPKEAMAPKYPANVPPSPPLGGSRAQATVDLANKLGGTSRTQPSPLPTPEPQAGLPLQIPSDRPQPVARPAAAPFDPETYLRGVRAEIQAREAAVPAPAQTAPQTQPISEPLPPLNIPPGRIAPQTQGAMPLRGVAPPISETTVPTQLPVEVPAPTGQVSLGQNPAWAERPLPEMPTAPVIAPRSQGEMTLPLSGEAPPIAETNLPPPRTPQVIPATAPAETLPPTTGQKPLDAVAKGWKTKGMKNPTLEGWLAKIGVDIRGGGTDEVDPAAIKGNIPGWLYSKIFNQKTGGKLKPDELALAAREMGFPFQTDREVVLALQSRKTAKMTAEKMTQGEAEKAKKEGYWEGIARQLMEEKDSAKQQNDALDMLGIPRETAAPETVPETVPFDVGEPTPPPRGIREPGQEGFARLNVDHRKLGKPIRPPDFQEAVGAFITEDGKIIDIGSRPHVEALHKALGSKFKLAYATIGDWWHNTMRDTNLVRAANYDGQMIFEMHEKPTQAQVDAIRSLKQYWPKLRFMAEMWPGDYTTAKGQRDYSKLSEVHSFWEFAEKVADPRTWSVKTTPGNQWVPGNRNAAQWFGQEGFANTGEPEQKGLLAPDNAPVGAPQSPLVDKNALIDQILRAKDSNVSKRDLLGLNKAKKPSAVSGKGFDFTGKLFSSLPAFMIPWIVGAMGRREEKR